MKTVLPKVIVPGDNQKQDMAHHAGLVGLSFFHMVWSFGFLPGTDYAKYYGVSTPEKIFVLSNFDGEIKDTFQGDIKNLPKKFQKVIDYKYPWVMKQLFGMKRSEIGLVIDPMDDGVEPKDF